MLSSTSYNYEDHIIYSTRALGILLEGTGNFVLTINTSVVSYLVLGAKGNFVLTINTSVVSYLVLGTKGNFVLTITTSVVSYLVKFPMWFEPHYVFSSNK